MPSGSRPGQRRGHRRRSRVARRSCGRSGRARAGWLPRADPGRRRGPGRYAPVGSTATAASCCCSPTQHQPLTLGGVRAHWLRARLLAAVARAAGLPGFAAGSAHHGRAHRRHRGRRAQRGDRSTTSSARATASPTSRSVAGRPPSCRGRTTRSSRSSRQATGTFEEWTEVTDFVDSHRDDRHFAWDSFTGEIRFGPLIRYPDGSMRQHGAIPPEGAAHPAQQLSHRRWLGGQRRHRHTHLAAHVVAVRHAGAEPDAGERWRRRRDRREREAPRSTVAACRRTCGHGVGLRAVDGTGRQPRRARPLPAADAGR